MDLSVAAHSMGLTEICFSSMVSLVIPSGSQLYLTKRLQVPVTAFAFTVSCFASIDCRSAPA